MANGKVIGIDLGTTMSVVAFTDEGGTTTTIAGVDGQRIIPSVVYFQPDGDMVVGDRARQYAVVDPARVAMLFKRGMGTPYFLPDDKSFVIDGKVWSPEELSSLVLKKLKQMAEEFFTEPVSQAVVTVPAYFGEQPRGATVDAGELAGLKVLRIQNEPTAAAIAHGLDSGAEPGKILVFDLGGGTFDVTVMDISAGGQLTVISTGGDRQLGGADFDKLILDRIAEQVRAETDTRLEDDVYVLSEAKEKAEDLKKELSTARSATRMLRVGGRPVTVTISRDEFDKMLERYTTEIRDTVENTVDDANLRPSDLSKVLMVGGSSRIPAMQTLLADLLGQQPTFSRNLDEDVARGAAMMAAKLADTVDPRTKIAMMPKPKDVTSKGLGITVTHEDLITKHNDIMIAANTPIPAEADETYETLEDGQQEILVELNEGDDRDLRYVENLGKSPARFGMRVRKGYPIRVHLAYTDEQIIKLDAYDGENGKFLCHMEVPRKGRISLAAKEAARTELGRRRVE